MIYHIILFFFVLSNYRIVFTAPGSPPDQFKVKPETMQSWKESGENLDSLLSRHLGMEVKLDMKARDGSLRYCQTCHYVKPDRTHHCSVCNACVTKFDHHCPCKIILFSFFFFLFSFFLFSFFLFSFFFFLVSFVFSFFLFSIFFFSDS